MEKTSLIRAIYLYLASIIGLMFIVASVMIFINLGLKAFVFTKADMDYYPRDPYVQEVQVEEVAEGTAEKEIVKKGIAPEKIDYRTSQRQRDASNAIAMLVVGLALYLYHWKIIQKENKKK